MSDRELMQQALEALDGVLCDPLGKCCIDGSDADRQIVDSALDALRERLAQPEQEPVAWYCKEGLKRGVSLIQESPEWEPLYTAPTQRKPLSDDEADELVRRFARYELIRAIEAAHGIKGGA